MIKMVFPFDDQLKKSVFRRTGPLQISFCVNETTYEWEIGCNGIIVYLHNHTAHTSKHIYTDPGDLTVYLHGHTVTANKYIFVTFEKLGVGLTTLGDLDPLSLAEIDAYTLGDISYAFADWMVMKQPVVEINGTVYVRASETAMSVESSSVLAPGRTIYLEHLDDHLGLSDLSAPRYTTLGELDPNLLEDMDTMLSTFRLLEHVPAHLVKEIRVTQRNVLDNLVVSPQSQVTTGASSVAMAVRNEVLSCMILYRLGASHTSMRIGVGSVNASAELYFGADGHVTAIRNDVADVSVDKYLGMEHFALGLQNAAATAASDLYLDAEMQDGMTLRTGAADAVVELGLGMENAMLELQNGVVGLSISIVPDEGTEENEAHE
jgi:hypothetical protein